MDSLFVITRNFFLLFVVASTAWAASKKSTGTPANLTKLDPGYSFGQVHCAKGVIETLENWKSKDDWRPAAPTASGNMILVSPAADFGTWIEVILAPTGGRAALRLIRSEAEVFVSFDQRASCRPTIAARTNLPARAKDQASVPFWNDQKLEFLLGSHSRGMIYFWSPHMPYSWKGVEEVRKLAKQNPDLAIEIMMDPRADRSVGLRIVKKNRWPEKYLRQVESTEFLMRGFYLHAPTLIPFKNKAFTFHLPGYRDAKFMKNFLKKSGVL